MAMTAWEQIERARAQTLIDEDGNDVELIVSPHLSDPEIEEVARRVGVALPAELVELLHRCGEVDGVLEVVVPESPPAGWGRPPSLPSLPPHEVSSRTPASTATGRANLRTGGIPSI